MWHMKNKHSLFNARGWMLQQQAGNPSRWFMVFCSAGVILQTRHYFWNWSAHMYLPDGAPVLLELREEWKISSDVLKRGQTALRNKESRSWNISFWALFYGFRDFSDRACSQCLFPACWISSKDHLNIFSFQWASLYFSRETSYKVAQTFTFSHLAEGTHKKGKQSNYRATRAC